MIRRAFVLETGTRIEPFGDPASESLIVNKTLRDALRDSLAACGITRVEPLASAPALPKDGEPSLVIADDLYLSRTLLKAFLEGAGDGVERLALPSDARSVKDSLPLQDVLRGESSGKPWAAFPAWTVGAGKALAVTAFDAAVAGETIRVVDPRETVETITGVPRAFAPDGTITFALTARVAMRLSSWVHVLRVNHLALMAGLASARENRVLAAIGAVMGALAKAFPSLEPRFGRMLVRKGKRVKIHPTAVVEASILGDDVKIGAHTVVRASVLGNGCVVEDFGCVEMSVLAPRACITKRTLANFCVLYPGAVMGPHGAQMSLFGRDSFIAADSRIMDLKLDGDVPVVHRGKSVSSGGRFLGGCLGHGASLGAGVFVQYGVALPNGAQLVRDPNDVAREVLPGTGPLVVSLGSAVTLREAMRRRRGTAPKAVAK